MADEFNSDAQVAGGAPRPKLPIKSVPQMKADPTRKAPVKNGRFVVPAVPQMKADPTRKAPVKNGRFVVPAVPQMNKPGGK